MGYIERTDPECAEARGEFEDEDELFKQCEVRDCQKIATALFHGYFLCEGHYCQASGGDSHGNH